MAIFHARMHLLLDITPFMAILQEFFLVFLPCKKARPKHTVLEGFFGTFLQKKITKRMPKSLISMILGSVR